MPKKDMCKTCVAYENMSKKASEQEAYFKNVKRKEESCAEKAKDKERASLLTYNNSKVTTSLTFSETHISGDRKHDYHAVHQENVLTNVKPINNICIA